jgi:hypothetical protein
MRGRVRIMTTTGVHAGNWPATSLPQRCMAKTRTAETCATFSATEMHMTILKISPKNETESSANDARKGTMIIMALTMTSPTGNVPDPEDAMREGVHWPLNFNPSGIEKCDGSTNPAEWLKVY